MKIFFKKTELTKFIHNEKGLGFVPTMGAIHQGHISLINKSIRQCDKTIVSIFINKPQFDRKNDYKNYPRLLKKDIAQLKKLRINYLYIPNMRQMYPNGTNNTIKISNFGKKLCGRFRPKHFEAIADVVERFIKIIKPQKIYFGEKDMQQLKIMEQFIKKKYKNIKVIGCKTIREKNGLALSSRNKLLSLKEKKIGSNIYKFLKSKKKNLISKKVSLNFIKNEIKKLGSNKVEYLEVIDINKLFKPHVVKNNYKIFVAYYLRKTRLIDNV